MKKIYTDITFNPTAKTVQFNYGVSSSGGNPPIFPAGKVLLIINATRGVVYYNFASSTAKATFSSSGQHWVATLTDASTTGHSSADSIIAYYDDAANIQAIKGDVFASIQNPLVAELSAVGANGFDSDKTFLIDLTKYSGSTFGLLVGGGGPFSFTIHNGTSSNPPTVVTNPITGDKYTTVPATNGWHVFRVDGNASGGPSLNLNIKKVSGTANPGTQQTFRFFALQNPSDISAIAPVSVRTKSWVIGDAIASGSAGGTGNINLSYPPQAASDPGGLTLPPNCDGFAFEIIAGGGSNTFTFEWGSYSPYTLPGATGPSVVSAVPAVWETPSGDSGTSVNNVYGQKFYFRIPSPKLLGGIYSPRFRAIKGASDTGSCIYAFYPIQLNPLPQGAATAANQATANTSLSNIDTDLGALADSAASNDTGSFSLISLFKRLLSTKLPEQSSGRIPVTLASAGTTGSTAPTTANLYAGTDGTNLRAISVDTSGRPNTNIIPQSGNITTRSSTITTGGTSQQVAASNTSRKYFAIQNISDTDMYLGVGYTPTTTTGILLTKSGGGLAFESTFIPTQAINILCATTGKAFVAWEG